jgi:hypothetical protein
VDAELGREVGDPQVGLFGVLVGEPGRGGQVRLERLPHAVQVGNEPVVVGQLLEPGLGGGREQPDRAVVELLEAVRVDPAEQGDGVRVPAPPQVVGQLVQGQQPVRQPGQDGERADGAGRHAGTSGLGHGASARGEVGPTALPTDEARICRSCFTDEGPPSQPYRRKLLSRITMRQVI